MTQVVTIDSSHTNIFRGRRGSSVVKRAFDDEASHLKSDETATGHEEDEQEYSREDGSR